ncbi:MAG: site-specific DNA-methyltransferase [Pseudomonadota bacterium]
MARDYDNYTKDELIRLIRERDRKPRFGLVWERDEIDHDKSLNNDFVVLEHDPELSCGQEPYGNLVIEGDNFDALRYLTMTHSGRVKCIYIDPPYNTGKNDFIYNDRFVDKDDVYKHSKWLEFMYRRLIMAKDLLAEDGVIFVSIGEDEFSHLSVLMDQVFPGMKVGTFVWRRRSGANDAKEWFVSVDHEYVLCYANHGFSFAGTAKNLSSYSNPDEDPRGDWDSGDLNKAHNFKQRPEAYYPLHNPETDTWYPCDPGSVWRFATKARIVNGKKIRTKPIEQMIEEKRVLWPQDEKTVVYSNVYEIEEAIHDGSAPKNLQVYSTLDELRDQVAKGQAPERLLGYIEPLEAWVGRKIGYGKPRYKRFAKELKNSEQPVSTWILPSAVKKAELQEIDMEGINVMQTGYTSEGTSQLAQMIGNKDFAYPKPISLIKALIDQATDSDGDHVVVDFFAGSGTTGHAVMDLNKEDDGNRSFILVSSTEASVDEPEKNVCRDITSKRLKAAINGYTYQTSKGKQSVEGLGGEFGYMHTRRIPLEEVFSDIQHDQIWYALQLIHVGAIKPYDSSLRFQQSGDELDAIIYLPLLDEDVVADVERIADSGLRSLAIYSWQPGQLRQRISAPNVSFEAIPQHLVDRFASGGAK